MNWVATGPTGMMNSLYMHAQTIRLKYLDTLVTDRSHILSKLVPYDMYMELFVSYGNKIGNRWELYSQIVPVCKIKVPICHIWLTYGTFFSVIWDFLIMFPYDM